MLSQSTAASLRRWFEAQGVAGLAAYGHDIEKWSGKDHHKTAVPAVFLVRDGKVAWAHFARDYKTRPSTEQLLVAMAP